VGRERKRKRPEVSVVGRGVEQLLRERAVLQNESVEVANGVPQKVAVAGDLLQVLHRLLQHVALRLNTTTAHSTINSKLILTHILSVSDSDIVNSIFYIDIISLEVHNNHC